jgi:hypothetical protein
MKKKLHNLIATLWRRHEYDYSDIKLGPLSGPIDAALTNAQNVSLYYVVYCRHCDKAILVSRRTFERPRTRQLLFCRRDPLVYEHWLERQIERKKELDGLPPIKKKSPDKQP